MGKRKKLPTDVETSVLTKSARRCALCLGLEDDFELKRGQVSHLGQDPSRVDEDDLVFLCFNHHDEYDTPTSQSKGLTEAEVRVYRARLYDVVANRVAAAATRHLAAAPDSDATTRIADQQGVSAPERATTAPDESIFAEWVDGSVQGWTRAKWQLDVYARTPGPIRITKPRFLYWPVGARALQRERGPSGWKPRPIGEGRERDAATIEFPLDWIPNERRNGQPDAARLVEIFAEVEYLDESTGRRGTVTAGPRLIENVPPLPREARALLVQATEDPTGTILRIPGGLGKSTTAFQTNARVFGTDGDPRLEATWEDALDRLEGLDLVRDTGYKRQVFKVTDAGYKLADAIGPTAG